MFPFLIILQLISTSAFNILVHSPAFAGSHTNFMANLADTLTEAGHNVTFLVPIVDEARRNQLGVRVTKDVVFLDHDKETKRKIIPIDDNINDLWTMDIHSTNAWKMFRWFDTAIPLACDNFLRNKAVFQAMKSRNFDLAIIEPVTVCGLGFIKALGIQKTIVVSSQSHYDFVLPYIGESLEESYVPSIFCQTSDRMSLMERYENSQIEKATSKVFMDMFDQETATYRKYLGQDLPDWRDLLAESSLHFTNSNPIIEFPRPALQKTIHIGGVAVNLKKIRSQKLSPDWEEILSRRNRTMLISFGSLVGSSGMPEEWKRNLLEVIRSEPNVTFIWKYEKSDVSFADGVENVVISKWVPQAALLNDERLKAFLTHGGLGSTNELAYCGKPALMIPVFADQARNGHMLARLHTAIALKKTDLANFPLIRQSVHDILYDESYTRNARRVAEMLQNQPVNPKELVVKYTEFVGQYGPFPEWDPAGRRLNWWQKNLIDVYAMIVLSPVVIVIAVGYGLKYCVDRRIRKWEKGTSQRVIDYLYYYVN